MKKPELTYDGFKIAARIARRLTEDELRLLAAYCRSDAWWPGLIYEVTSETPLWVRDLYYRFDDDVPAASAACQIPGNHPPYGLVTKAAPEGGRLKNNQGKSL